MNDGYAWGGGPDLSAWETVMWRTYDDPRTRAHGVFVELLDREPEWDRLVHAHERGSLEVPRLRERIIEPAVPVGTPAWSPDPGWVVEAHLRRTSLPAPGTMEQLHTAVAEFAQEPLDCTRAPWQALLVAGLEGGRAAYLFKAHHVLGDGVAIMQLLGLVHSHTPTPSRRQAPTPPRRPSVTAASLAAKRFASLTMGLPAQMARRVPDVTGRVVTDPVAAAKGAVGYLASLRRQMAPPQVPRSPLLAGQGGLGTVVLTLDVPLAALRAAGKASGGTINDAYLAGLLGGLRRYHEHFGVVSADIPITIPVSTRTSADAAGGNQFSAARLVGPMAEADPAQRIRLLRAQVRRARNEPAIAWLDTASRVLDRAPAGVLVDLVLDGTSWADAQLSSFPGLAWQAYVAGAKVTGIYAVGPRPGTALMSIMLSYEGKACIGLHLDPDVFTDVELLRTCLLAGFEEVFALAGPGAAAAHSGASAGAGSSGPVASS